MTPGEKVQQLVNYLENTIPPSDETVVVATDLPVPPPSIVEEIVNAETPIGMEDSLVAADEDMTDLMAKVKRIGMCAKDLHYRAKGKPFYGLHQLADLAYEVESDTDQIAEVYFLGDRNKEPPRMEDVYTRAIALNVLYPKDDTYFIGGLMDICRMTMHSIEGIKGKYPTTKAGVHAVLDKISEHCLLSIGLLDQTLKH